MTGVDLPILLPEILLALYAMAALLVWVYGGKDKWAGALTWTTAAVLVAVALIVATKNGLGCVVRLVMLLRRQVMFFGWVVGDGVITRLLMM